MAKISGESGVPPRCDRGVPIGGRQANIYGIILKNVYTKNVICGVIINMTKSKEIKIVEDKENVVVVGLGDDSLVYFWDVKTAKWILYKIYE